MQRNKAFKYSTTFYRRKNELKQKNITKSSSISNSISNVSEEKESERNAVAVVEDERNHENNILDHYTDDDMMATCSDNEMDDSDCDNEIYPDFEADTNISLGNKIKNGLQPWALENNISQSALNKLLQMLTSCGISGLPKDSRTILKTPMDVTIYPMGSGQFWYNGLKKCLTIMLGAYDSNITQLKVNFHIDGLPINKSSKYQFWPILMNCVTVGETISSQKPYVVAIFYGDSKPPSAQEYLEKFIEELNDLLENGVSIGRQQFQLFVNAFICDTPARSFIKCTVSFNAYHSCLKCKVAGEYFKQERHMSFPQTDCTLRTNSDFRRKVDSDHHQKDIDGECIASPLEQIGTVDMIKDIPVSDSLHLIDLGVVKKCLTGWVNGNKNIKFKFPNNQINVMSSWLLESNSRMPKEIHRSVRSLNVLAFWKATEFHTFLFYLGPVILKDHLPNELYKHFLLLHCAVVLCSSKIFTSNLNLAHELFIDYIEGFISNYGVDSISSNIHNLCHVVDDVKMFGILPNISSYCFENKLGLLKNLLRSGNKPLSQIARRLNEMDYLIKNTSTSTACSSLQYEENNPSKLNPQIKHSFKKVILSNGITFQANNKDEWILTKNDCIIKVLSISMIEIFGYKLKKLCNFYDYPFKSSYIHTYISDGIFLETVMITEENIKSKMISLHYKNKIVFLPLIHTLNIFNENNLTI